MKPIFLEYSTSTLSTIKFWDRLVKFWVYHTLFKSGISMELAKSRHTTQWYTHVLGISQRQHLQISLNLESMHQLYYEDLIHIYCGNGILP